uniref:Zf-AD domain-containing protein n=1 Tax=Angiostrongylus cantonensis TaxID=6313 RepID=A0A0K0D0R3_ANGCA
MAKPTKLQETENMLELAQPRSEYLIFLQGSMATERISDGTRCLRCGINLRNRRSFDLKIKEADITLTIKGICCGCKQEYYCGEMERPSYSDQSTVDTEYVSYTSTSLDRTFDERGIRASSTPLQKHAMSPVISSRASKL